jgi:hypothetical protein
MVPGPYAVNQTPPHVIEPEASGSMIFQPRSVLKGNPKGPSADNEAQSARRFLVDLAAGKSLPRKPIKLGRRPRSAGELPQGEEAKQVPVSKKNVRFFS